MAASAAVMRNLVEAFRSGGGVPYEAYGAEYREAQQDFTRPLFANLLGGWIEALPDVHERLRLEPPARVLDLACGAGIACIELARRYPDARSRGSTSTRAPSTRHAPTRTPPASTCASTCATPARRGSTAAST